LDYKLIYTNLYITFKSSHINLFGTVNIAEEKEAKIKGEKEEARR